MNCKPGDLAIIVGGFPENLGKVVTVIEKFVAPEPFFVLGYWLVRPHSPCRNFNGQLVMLDGAISDHNLRPLRDNDGQDETLTWAGKPQQINSPELVK